MTQKRKRPILAKNVKVGDILYDEYLYQNVAKLVTHVKFVENDTVVNITTKRIRIADGPTLKSPIISMDSYSVDTTVLKWYGVAAIDTPVKTKSTKPTTSECACGCATHKSPSSAPTEAIDVERALFKDGYHYSTTKGAYIALKDMHIQHIKNVIEKRTIYLLRQLTKKDNATIGYIVAFANLPDDAILHSLFMELSTR